MEHIVQLSVGDWSNDGHSKTQYETIKSNISKNEMDLAYKEGAKITGDVIDGVCDGYEECNVDASFVEKFQKLGFDFKLEKNEIKELKENDELYIDPERWIEIVMFVVKLGNPSFQYEITENNTFHCGGYGLLS